MVQLKTRNSFVSNSSSASFIITGGRVVHVALAMYKEMLLGYDKEELTIGDRQKLRSIERIADNPKVDSGEIGVMFPSINYNTYLIRNDNKVMVSTSNNHNWDRCWDDFISVTTGRGDDEEYSDDCYAYMRDKFFKTVLGSKPIIKKNFSNPPDGKGYVCRICSKRDYDSAPKSYCVLDINERPYCPWHYVRMKEVDLKASIQKAKEELNG